MKLTRHQAGGRRFGRWLIGIRSTACRSQREKNAPTYPIRRLVILSNASALPPCDANEPADDKPVCLWVGHSLDLDE